RSWMINGDTVRNAARVSTSAFMATLLRSCVFNRTLNSSEGSVRSMSATAASGAMSSIDPAGAPVSSESIARSSRSTSSRSSIGGLQLSPQVLDGSQLKLFHRALAPSQHPGNLADALLLDEPQPDDLGLCLGQPIDQLKQDEVSFDFLRVVPLRPCHRVA